MAGPCPHGRHRPPRRAGASHRPWLPRLLPLAGLLALAWFLIRVVPRPSRAAYPCQRAAAPLAGGFVLWLAALAPATFVPRLRPGQPRRRWLAPLALVAAAATGAATVTCDEPGPGYDGEDAIPMLNGSYSPALGPNQPVGEGVGVHPGRVVWVRNPDATAWDGEDGAPWDHVDGFAVEKMVDGAVRQLAGEATTAGAWAALFDEVDRRRGREPAGVRAGDSIAIKVNANCDGEARGDTSPFTVRALLRALVEDVGVAPGSITVLDASRQLNGDWIGRVKGDSDRFDDVVFGVRRILPAQNGGRRVVDHDPMSRLHLAGPPSLIPPGSAPVSLPAPITAARYLVNAAALKPHALAGVSLTAKNHFGSIYREGGFNDGWSPAFLHDAIQVRDPADFPPEVAGRYSPLVELIGHPDLGGKTALYLIDALYSSRSSEDGPPDRWRSDPFDGHWTSSVLLSQDPVAVDSVAVDLLHAEAQAEPIPWLWGDLDGYLLEAAQAGAPPSGTVYDPDGDGTPLESLGVHEHWSGPVDRAYSRNLGRAEGIELVGIGPGTQPGSTVTRAEEAPSSASAVSTPPESEQTAPSQVDDAPSA